jgi:beta-lactamase superfamily II metal-dependent hydrolase
VPFVKSGHGQVTYQGSAYNVVECGGGGNCLFLSVAWLLNHYQLTGHPYAHGTLRAHAATRLQQWVNPQAVVGMPVRWSEEGTPGTIQNLQLSATDAQDLANDREYGDLGAVAAMIAELRLAGRDVEIHVLDGTKLHAHVFRSTNIAPLSAPEVTIHLYYESFVHYQALVPAARVALVDPMALVANFENLFARGALTSTLKGSLQSGSQPSKTTTLSIPAGTVLEIHHIDVGQGDATLVMIKDATDTIRFSLLLDAGERQGQVTAYFDTLIATGNFRPLDMFVASHPDKDHIADSKNVLDNPKYTSENAILYDSGTPPKCDREYLDSYQKNRLAGNRRRPPLQGEVLKDFLGVTLRCLACNGVMRNGYAPEKGHYWLHQGFGQGHTLGALEYDPSPQAELQIDRSSYPTDKNDYSIALLLTFGSFSYFSAGDLSGSFEEDVAYHVNYFYGPVTVWKAGHHGAQTSSSARAVSYLQGRFCVLSFGTDNMHGHPHQAPLDHLEALNGAKVPCTYYATGQAQAGPFNPAKPGVLGSNGRDDKGTIIVRTTQALVKSQEAFEVWTERNNNGWEPVVCAARAAPRVQNSQAPIVASASVGKKSKPLSSKQKHDKKARSTARKNEQLDRARKLLNKAIAQQMPPDMQAAYDIQIIRKDTAEWFEGYVQRLSGYDLDGKLVMRDAAKMAREILHGLGIV